MRNRLVLFPLAIAASLALSSLACDSSGGGDLRVAPIDSAQVVVLDTQPPQYTVEIVAGLPDGCSSPGEHHVKRDGNTFEIEVLNKHTGAEVCTAIYGMYELTVALQGVQSGQAYNVKVNDQTLSFAGD